MIEAKEFFATFQRFCDTNKHCIGCKLESFCEHFCIGDSVNYPKEKFDEAIDFIEGWKDNNPSPLLNEEEMERLIDVANAVNRYHEDSILSFICKKTWDENHSYLCLRYTLDDGGEDSVDLLKFSNKEAYINLEPDIDYALEELGLGLDDTGQVDYARNCYAYTNPVISLMEGNK